MCQMGEIKGKEKSRKLREKLWRRQVAKEESERKFPPLIGSIRWIRIKKREVKGENERREKMREIREKGEMRK